MYREDHKEDYKYLLSRQTFSCMYFILKRKLSPKRRRAHLTDRNRMFATDYEGKKHGLKVSLPYAKEAFARGSTQAPYNEQLFNKYFYGKVLPMIDNNPNIKFTIFMPPYYIYTLCIGEYYNIMNDLINQRTTILKELIKRKNVTLYDYQATPKYTLEDKYFCDLQHFNNAAAVEILKDLKAENRRLSTNLDIDKNEQELRNLIKSSMPKFYKDIVEAK